METAGYWLEHKLLLQRCERIRRDVTAINTVSTANAEKPGTLLQRKDPSFARRIRHDDGQTISRLAG